MKKKLSKTAQKKKDTAISVALRKKFEAQQLEKDRMIEDSKDGILNNEVDLSDLNSKNFEQVLQSSGLNTDSNPFADMERIVNNNESIRELVDIKNMRLKTNVTDEQHKIIVILGGAYNTLLQESMKFDKQGIDFSGLKDLLGHFIELAPSIDGGRAEQFVEAHQAVANALANAKGNPNAITESNNMKN